MNSVRSILIFLFLLSMAWWGLVPVSSADPIELNDDTLLAVEEKTLYFTASDLLANDSVGDEVSWLEVVDGPTLGHLANIGGREGGVTEFFYTPPGVVAATWDSFTYKPLGSAPGVTPARVAIRVQPARRPIGGRWQTFTCHESSCPLTGDLGEGAEIGWYHSVTAVFELCDWQDTQLVDCRSVAVPPAYKSSGLEPLVGDWDGDTWDEPAVFDPASGTLHLFDLVMDGEGEALPDKLVLLASGLVAPKGSLAVTGVFETDAAPVPVERFGWFDRAAEGFWLERPTGAFRWVEFKGGSGQQEPVAGDWYGDGLDDLGLWHPDSSELWIRGPEDTASVEILEIRDSPSGQPARGQPFTGRVLRNSKRSFFGLYDPSIDKFRLHLLVEGSPGTLPMQILVDPP